MLSIIFAFVIIWILFRTLALGFRVAWGITKILLPLFIVIGLIYIGIVYFAVPIIIVFGIAVLFFHAVKA